MSTSISIWQRIRRTPYQTIAAVFMVFVTMFVMAVFLFLAGTSSAILTYFETKPQLTIFFEDNKEKESIDTLINKFKETGKTGEIRYISKEQALAIYQKQNKDDPLLLEMVTADILPASLEVSATSPKYLVELAEIAKKETGIDEVVFQKDVVDTLITWTSTIRKVGIVFILFLLTSTIFILVTNIGMKIALRRQEIEILKLVGATNWYIKKPFIFEGVIIGMSGAITAFLVVSAGILYFTPFISSFLQGIPSLPLIKIENMFEILIWPPNIFLYILLFILMVFAGFLIGFLGSLFAVSRYMKHVR